MKRFQTLLLISLSFLFTTSLLAQDNPGSTRIGAKQRDALVDQISELLEEIYIFPDVAEQMEKLIAEKNRNGDYQSFDTLLEFAEQITADLQSVSHDRHLNVSPARGMAAQPMDHDDEGSFEQRMAAAARGNFGFQRVEILPGNIGYVDLRGFIDAQLGGPTAIAAMNFLAHTNAIIFDLRRNGGGSPSMIQLITSYFFEEPQHLNSFYIRRSDSTEQYWTQASVPGMKMTDTPVYILTSGYTFSAAEEFTYNLKNMKRATVVGETTGGGAHPVDMHFLDLGDGAAAMVSMPYGRAINPITGTNWEGTGVAPDIEAPSEQALEVAQIDILNKLAENTGNEEERFTIEWARDELEFNQGIGVPESWSANDFVGQYGPRKIFLDGDQLKYQREGGPALSLSPMAGTDRFHVGDLDYFRIQFERNAKGRVIGLQGHYNDGRVDGNQLAK